ncbi:class 1 fructose-bisphosphatase [Desulfurobacterium crinifex]
MAVPFTAYLLTAKEEIPHLDDDLILLLNEIVSATKEIAGKVRKAGLLSILGSTGKTNIQGEEVQKLDELANEILLENLKNCGKACQIASEEIEDCLIVSESGYTVAFDPLDGSSNIDVNVSIGTIFSIHKDSLIKPGREQLAAGYVIYGPSTMLIMSLGKGVVGFTFDPESGNFILSHPEIKLPEKGKIYSINEANRDKWTSEGLRKFVDSLKGEKYTLRYVGSMVADVHRTLLKGGIFIYPADKKNTNGKLRLLYEASPMSFLIEQAGGIGTTGRERILDIVPEDLHQRVPVIIGSKWEVEKCLEFLKEYDS